MPALGADERADREQSGMYDHWDDAEVRDVIAERDDDYRREQWEAGYDARFADVPGEAPEAGWVL